ncbi:branched-chain amino acid ABC transporter permease [Paenibacillus xerothermodurans]|uniref:Branched-chain amino acid ABC transporter permease n=1 Tax=Paenibacillus xerothermodurans TaxID=1977292 RepID=A0A2W1P6R3_PAEXE|nr:branched-chain amino acid ABC transporter permease [Paenibacillus xerothermodurans]PZE22748.1 branched-chain amino acid ABC transporter permease [Paenibacillus xerothermodurans]
MSQAIVHGILMGSVYGLIALGLTLIFGIMKVINFGHGTFLMIAMFLSYFGVTTLGLHPYISLIIVVPAMFVIGYACNHFLVQPVLNKEADVREPVGALLLTAAVSIALENGILASVGGDYRTIKTSFSDATVSFFGIHEGLSRIYAFVLCIIVTIIFYLVMNKTEIGRQIRAVGQDRSAAKLMGINVGRTFNIAFGLGMALLGTAGVALLPFNQLYPTIGGLFGTTAFVTVVLGGLGSIPGALIGGLLIGVVESVATVFVAQTLAPAFVLFGFLIFLTIRPSGLFGSPHDW